MVRIEDDLKTVFSGDPGRSAICLGNFDGVHLGHAALLQKNDQEAKERGLCRRIVTFEPHPRILMKDPTFRLIESRELKTAHLESLQLADEIIFEQFDDHLMHMAPEDFFEEILLSRYHAELITVGDDFHFGDHGKGDAALLQRMAEKHGVTVLIVPRIRLEGEFVSSSRIREALENGQMELAEKLMGRTYELGAVVSQGKHVGRKLQAPTVNMLFEEEMVVPRHGVYVSEICLEDGQIFQGVSNVGINPTFGREKPRIETYIFDFHEDLYGKKIIVRLLKFLRPERKFESAEALKEQIGKDINEAKCFYEERLKQ